jgi:hypothetical protein
LQWREDNNTDVKQTKHAVVNGVKGTYSGEHSKMHGKPEGKGIFASENELILGSFLNGSF